MRRITEIPRDLMQQLTYARNCYLAVLLSRSMSFGLTQSEAFRITSITRGTSQLSQSIPVHLLWSLVARNGLQDIGSPVKPLAPFVSKSSEQLKLFLSQGVDYRPWIDIYAGWPEGLVILLDAGIEPSFETLEIACSERCYTSVENILQSISLALDIRAIDLVEENLSSELISSLNIRPGTLLDRNAFSACQLLRDHGVDITGLEQEDVCSVYDATCLTTQVAEQLWQAGFRDIDLADWSLLAGPGIVSGSWSLNLLVKAAWLISKGADLHLPNSRSNVPAIFYFSHAVGVICGRGLSWGKSKGLAMLRIIVLDNFRDDCSCPCSREGCSAITKLLQGMCDTSLDWRISRARRGLRGPYKCLWKLLEGIRNSELLATDCSFDANIAQVILRYITFHELDLTHTCHQLHKGYDTVMDPEIVNEIQKEQQDNVRNLETLVKEFVDGYVDSQQSLHTYIEEVVWPRVNNFKSGSMTESEIYGLRELGVILHDLDKKEDKDEYGKLLNNN
ncbi:hypothetical protein BJY04DRAFT_31490 [Aspergillus karnatakaensis]|uniref:uncharacterized protein n=1 Tax=Aspergillus karnatakaensis TaxID=1810916 RepID=UPI003CCDD825